MKEEITENYNQYYIFFFDGEKTFVLGKTETYEGTLDKAAAFDEKIDAIRHVEKHGYEKITTIRRVKLNKVG